MFSAISNFYHWTWGTRSQALVQDPEEEWIMVENSCREIIPFESPLSKEEELFTSTAYTVEMPEDDEEIVSFYTARKFTPLTGPQVEDITDREVKMPVVEDTDLSLSLLSTSNSNQNRAVPGSIVTLAVAAGAAAQNAGIGAVILETGVGTYYYTMMVNPYSWQITQFIAGRTAQSMASSCLATTVGGVSLPVIANIAFAGVTVIAVAWGAVNVYNALTSDETPVRGIDASRMAASCFLGIEKPKK